MATIVYERFLAGNVSHGDGDGGHGPERQDAVGQLRIIIFAAQDQFASLAARAFPDHVAIRNSAKPLIQRAR
ncbi:MULTISPECIES: hypothetical protein [unclassified Methylobacterium]|uniref:hypothetical protein n=1 Tax=unclassified Methylobacterium TaxID=2615210 RepID=UPI0011C1D27E|nr:MULTISPECIES: hypothetical protein [unclassified Methylobacterium]QEE38120.1 hypothetical protein FVA80_03155 [Methylobacterium sp. WL1]TXN59966.1 hypothetical protein FV241_00985 [Methylobacterium sp. WL2]